MDDTTHGVLIVTTSPAPGVSDADFDTWYDGIHIPELRTGIAGIESVERFRQRDDAQPARYLAVYRISRPYTEILEALGSSSWSGVANHVDTGAHPPIVAGYDAIR